MFKKMKDHHWMWLYYETMYNSIAIYVIYVPIYLKSLGYSHTQVGLLVSLYPIIILIALPFWGRIADRTKHKNRLVQLLLVSAGLCMFAFQFVESYWMLFIVLILYGFSFSSTVQISDSIILECIELGKSKWRYDMIRMGGTLGFAFMAFISGFAYDLHHRAVFVLYFITLMLSIIAIGRMPKVRGHQNEKNPTSFTKIFTSKRLLIYLGFYFLFFITFGFYNWFFGIYFNEITDSSILLGIVFFIPALSEVPILIYVERWIQKFGVRRILLVSAIISVIRWLLLGVSYNPYLVLAFQFMHGCGFIVFNYAMVMYIHKEVPKELRASGQTMLGFLGHGLGAIIGTQIGGVLADQTSLHQVFLYCAIFLLISLVAFYLLTFILRRRRKKANMVS